MNPARRSTATPRSPRFHRILPIALALLCAGCTSLPGGGEVLCDPELLNVSRINDDGRLDLMMDTRDLAEAVAIPASAGQPEARVLMRFCPEATAILRTLDSPVRVRLDGEPVDVEGSQVVGEDGAADVTQPDTRAARDLARRLAACASACP